MKRVLVVGAGIRGIISAIMLRDAGHDVTIIDFAALPGGILVGEEWEGLFLDKGCHLLNLSHDTSEKFYRRIMGNGLNAIERRYASINRGLVTTDIALPDMSLFPRDEQVAALQSLQDKKTAKRNLPENLDEFLVERYGDLAGSYAGKCAQRITGIDPITLAPEAFASIPMLSRIRVGPDEEMRRRKADPYMDDRLAAANYMNVDHPITDTKQITHTYYPSQHGMRGFCEASEKYLHKLGIIFLNRNGIDSFSSTTAGLSFKLKSGGQLTVDACYWSVPTASFLNVISAENPLTKYVAPLSLLLYYFKVEPADVLDFTYVHEYSNGKLCFRGSAPGLYGNQFDADGRTYVCAEVPVNSNSEIWAGAEAQTDRVWQALQDMAIVSKDGNYSASKILKLPVAAMLPKRGWLPSKHERDDLLETFGDKIIFSESESFEKSAIIDSVATQLERLL